ncbi:MAG TPA: DedA family protein, partial [Planctomycetota bacterium]|nr:DedA family protein [Planctomycetota bacterium]
RFVPIIRTFAPVVAGIAQMPYRRFAFYNVFGAFGWVTGLSILGYYLGQYELIKKNLEATILLIIFVSILPGIISIVKAKYFDKKPTLPVEAEKDAAAVASEK